MLTLLSKHGFVSYRDLAERLDVSEITIRRDLRVLREKGLIETVVGGGMLKRSSDEPGFINKRVLQNAEKEQIAKTALTLLESNMTIGFSAGTTTWTLAQELIGFQELTFVTNSTNIALTLKNNGWDDIHLTGGHFRTPSDALVGPLAESVAKQLHTDILFMGVHGIDLSHGLSTPNISEASINQVMMERTDKVVALIDHTKWGIEALAHIANIEDVDVIITDNGGGANEIATARNLGVEVMVAEIPE